MLPPVIFIVYLSRKQPTFCDGMLIPCKMTSEKQGQKFNTDDVSLPRLGNCFSLVVLHGKFLLANQKLYPWWRIICMEFLRSFLRRHFVRKPAVALWNVSCFSGYITLYLGKQTHKVDTESKVEQSDWTYSIPEGLREMVTHLFPRGEEGFVHRLGKWVRARRYLRVLESGKGWKLVGPEVVVCWSSIIINHFNWKSLSEATIDYGWWQSIIAEKWKQLLMTKH